MPLRWSSSLRYNSAMKKGRGRPRVLPEDYRVITLRISDQLHRALHGHAGVQRRSVNSLANEILEAWLEDEPDRNAIRRLTSTGRGPRK